MSSVDCNKNLCAFCDDSCSLEFSLFACLKGTCAEHAPEGMQPIQTSVDTNTPAPLPIDQFLMCVEVKSATTEEIVREELDLMHHHSKFIFIDITQDCNLFKRVIPKSAHRVQCVQHYIAFNVNLAFMLLQIREFLVLLGACCCLSLINSKLLTSAFLTK